MLNYRITKTMYNTIAIKRDSKGRIIQKLTKKDVIKYFNEIGCFRGLIVDLYIVWGVVWLFILITVINVT